MSILPPDFAEHATMPPGPVSSARIAIRAGMSVGAAGLLFVIAIFALVDQRPADRTEAPLELARDSGSAAPPPIIAANIPPEPKPKPDSIATPRGKTDLSTPATERPSPEPAAKKDTLTPAIKQRLPPPKRKPEGLALPHDGWLLPDEERASWSAKDIDKALAVCMNLFPGPVPGITAIEPRGGPGGCGAAAPLTVGALNEGTVAVEPDATLKCRMVAALNRWLVESVQPAAELHFKSKVASVRNVSSYVCRRRYGRATGKLSRHARANALDIATFTFENGEQADVESDWYGDGPATRFLRYVHTGACKVFGTVLGPNANAAHADHFHLDLGPGGICE